uniref:EsV-1-7 n=1 Tax=Heterosigma akashiwo TaxID=2829 RepID=A0A7S4DCB4_HETAK
MVNVQNKKRCKQAGCGKRPSFDFKGEQGGKFCAQHKLQGMVDVKHKTCEHAGCSKDPSFSFAGEQGGRFCAQHKVLGLVDMKNKGRRCEHARCSKRPCFNFEGDKKHRFCVQHKVRGMVGARYKRRKQAGCSKQPNKVGVVMVDFNVAQACDGAGPNDVYSFEI